MEVGLDLAGTMQILKRWRWVLCLVPLVCILIVTIFVVFVIPPIYEASTTLLVGRNTSTASQQEALRYEDLMLSQQLVKTYGEIVESWTVSEEVIRELALPLTSEQFKKKINVTLVSGTQIIRLGVFDRDPTLAQSIANSTVDVFTKRVPELTKLNNITVIDRARTPVKPAKPKKTLAIAVAGLLGLIAALAYVFAAEYLDDRIRNRSEAERILDIPVLGSIPKEKPITGTDGMISYLPLIDDPKSAVSEAYRSLRTNFQFYCSRKRIRVVTITSAQPMEGKTTVATNLAISVAQTGKRVILMDADLRRPAIHRVWGLPNEVGLSNLLIGGSDAPEEQLVKTPIDGLMLLTSGPTPLRPAELLGGARFYDVLGYLRTLCDLVIIDTPPVTAVTDAAIIGSVSDSVLLVTSKTRQLSVVQAKTALEQVNAQIMGLILNQVITDVDHYYER